MRANFDPAYDFEIVCDGGCLRNGDPDAEAYGSWRIRGKHKVVEHKSFIPFPHYNTSNQAEYMALLHALNDLTTIIHNAGLHPSQFSVIVKTDSRLVAGHFCMLPQQLKPWVCGDRILANLKNKAASLFNRFRDYRISLIPGNTMKSILGH